MIQILEKNRWLAILLTLISALIIFYASTLTFAGTGATSQIAVIYHFTAFSYLTLFLVISLTEGKPHNSLIVIGILIALIYGILDEIHQAFVPGRFAATTDLLINSFGIILTGLAYSNYINREK